MSDIDKDKRKKDILEIVFSIPLDLKKDKKSKKIYVKTPILLNGVWDRLIYQPVIFIRENQNGFVIFNFFRIHKSVRNNNQNVADLCQTSSRTI